MNTIKIFTKPEDLENLSVMTERIFGFLCQKSLFEKVKHDHNRMTSLGNVSFWLHTDPNNGDALLCYNKHPKAWDWQAISDEMEEIEKSMLIASGVGIVY